MILKTSTKTPPNSTKLRLTVVCAAIAMASAALPSASYANSCGPGAEIVKAQKEAIIKTAEKRQKVVDAVKEEVLSVQEACNTVIKFLPHDIVAQVGRFIGIAPPVTSKVQEYAMKKAANTCRKQLNVVKNMVDDAKDDLLKKAADATGVNSRTARRLVDDILEDGTFSDKNIEDAIASNSNIPRDKQKAVRDVIENIDDFKEDFQKGIDSISPPPPATPSALLSLPPAPNAPPPTRVQPSQQVLPPVTQNQAAPKQGPSMSAQQQTEDKSVMERLRGLF